MRYLLGFLLPVIVGCADSDVDPPPRQVTFVVTVGDDGRSEDVSFQIPEHTRSLTIVAQGAPDALLALGALAIGNRVDVVGLPTQDPRADMQTAYNQEQIGQMPGQLYQSIRLGTFTHVYPYRPDQGVSAGTGTLRIVSTRPGPVTVTLFMPDDDGATVLPLNLFVVSDTLADTIDPAFTAELARLFAQAGVTIRINRSERITGTAFERITDFTEPQESPTSQSAMLPGLVADRVTDGLDVFVVEALPSGVAGLALGTPGPPLRGSYYFGVVVRGGFPAGEHARVTAHEVAHFLALQHIENRGVSGRVYSDPLDDTSPGAGNLMEGGTLLTPDQAFALSRSALLVGE